MSDPNEHPPRDATDWKPKGIEWLWWGLLVVSLAVGFGMTMFAPI
jgi:hypothetical protein